MPRPKSKRPLTVHNIRLFAGDYDELDRLFPRLKAGPAIRAIVSNFIQRHKLAVKPLELDISVEELSDD